MDFVNSNQVDISTISVSNVVEESKIIVTEPLQTAALESHSVPIPVEMKVDTPTKKEENKGNIEIPKKVVVNIVQTPSKLNSVNASIPPRTFPRGSKRNGCRNVTVYERGDVIGQGTYGTVFKAKDPVSGKPVAIKKLNFMVITTRFFGTSIPSILF